MADDDEKRFKFRAFLSYSRRDEPAVRRLHRRLESFQIPKLFRKDGQRLGRFFRDKDELGAAAELGDALNNNINSSEWLIVCCSPAAAGSHWVNEEIKAFIATHGHERVLAAVLEGEPHDAFPPVLKEKEPLAADFRKTADGEDLGFLKLVAGILGVDLGELRDRQAAAERVRARTRAILASVFALLAVAASVSAVIAVQQRDRAQAMTLEAIDIGSGVVYKADDLSRKFGVPTSAVEELMNFADARFKRLFDEGVKTHDLDNQRATLLVQFSELYGRIGDTVKQRESAEAALKLFNAMPANKLSTFYYVRALAAASDGALALGHADIATDYAEHAVRESRIWIKDDPKTVFGPTYLAASLQRLGSIYMNDGEAAKAVPLFAEAVPLMEKVARDSNNARNDVTNLITIIDWLAGAQAATHDFAAAQSNFTRAESLARGWLVKEPDSLSAMSTLANTLMKRAAARYDQGDVAGAVAPIQESVAISRRIAGADARDGAAQRGLAQRLTLLSTYLYGLHQTYAPPLDEAIAILRAQAKGDPTNATLKGQLADTLSFKAGIASDSGDAAGARAMEYEIAAIRRDIKAAARGATAPTAALAGTLERIGDNSATLKDLPAMLTAYGEAVPLRREVLAAAPTDDDAQTALASTLQALGLSKKFNSDTGGALAALSEAAKIRTGLAKDDPTDQAIAFDAVDSWQQLAVIQAGIDGLACQASFQQAETLLARLAKEHPDDARYSAGLTKVRSTLKDIASYYAKKPPAKE